MPSIKGYFRSPLQNLHDLLDVRGRIGTEARTEVMGLSSKINFSSGAGTFADWLRDNISQSTYACNTAWDIRLPLD